jgi:hypothetical protein
MGHYPSFLGLALLERRAIALLELAFELYGILGASLSGSL